MALREQDHVSHLLFLQNFSNVTMLLVYVFKCPQQKRSANCGSGLEPSLTAFTCVCKVLTFHVVQSVSQHLEHGHVEWVAECGVVEISAGVSLQGRQRHLTAA